MSKGSHFNADNLQEMFERVRLGATTINETAKYYRVAPGTISNYFAAKRKYERFQEINHKTVGDAFTEWALKYGGNGEPRYKVQKSDQPAEEKQKGILFAEETWEPMARLFCWIKKNKVGVTITADGEMMLAAKQETFESLFKRS